MAIIIGAFRPCCLKTLKNDQILVPFEFAVYFNQFLKYKINIKVISVIKIVISTSVYKKSK